jgi:hypothetical protein
MKNLPVILLCLITLLSCNNNTNNNEYTSLLGKFDSVQKENDLLKNQIRILSDSIVSLKFSAQDRLIIINNLISKDKLEDAKKQIFELRELFPYSIENEKSIGLLNTIAKKEENKRIEEERIKALGYKVFKDNTSSTIDNVSLVLSGFTFGRTFTFDYCTDVSEYSYRTADKDNTYLLISLSLSTKDKTGAVPNFYLYRIENGNLKKIDTYFMEEYATWTSYGAKIGNYDDDSHDFSKVNTVRYKLAAEIAVKESSQPILMLAKKDGKKGRDVLTIDDVENDYLVIKIINRNKL